MLRRYPSQLPTGFHFLNLPDARIRREFTDSILREANLPDRSLLLEVQSAICAADPS